MNLKVTPRDTCLKTAGGTGVVQWRLPSGSQTLGWPYSTANNSNKPFKRKGNGALSKIL